MSKNLVRFLAIAFALAVVPLAPSALAQGPVEGGAGIAVQGCSRQCEPKAEDVNGAEVRTGDASVQTILYGHFQDILNRAPLNTQPPGEQEADLNRGFLMPTVSNAGKCAVSYCNVNFENNWFYMFSSAGFVEIVDGQWRTHQEPGLAETVELKGDTMTLYFYLSAHPVPGQSSDQVGGAGTLLDVMPGVGIYARMETGRHPLSTKSIVIAEGDTGDALAGVDPLPNVAPESQRTTIITGPSGVGGDIYEFAVPMTLNQNTIPSVWEQAEGFIVSINPHQIKGKTGAAEGWQVMQHDWRVRAGPATPPRLVMEVANPMVTKSASLTVFNQAMFIRWSFVSPWGSYDTDDRSIQVKVTGPTSIDASLLKLVIIKRSVDHDGHFKPINATWRFDYEKAGLKDGEYAVEMELLNLQHTYRLKEALTFKIVNGQPTDLKIIGSLPADNELGAPQEAPKKDSPAFELMGILSALVVGTVLMRRRRD